MTQPPNKNKVEEFNKALEIWQADPTSPGKTEHIVKLFANSYSQGKRDGAREVIEDAESLANKFDSMSGMDTEEFTKQLKAKWLGTDQEEEEDEEIGLYLTKQIMAHSPEQFKKDHNEDGCSMCEE